MAGLQAESDEPMDPDLEPSLAAEETTTTPNEVRYRVLSLVWCFPSLGALWLLGTGIKQWSFRDGLLPGLTHVRIEEWIALLLLALHAVWLLKWRQSTKE